ncbi:TonB-dependent receptor [Kineobactrum salinum]|uniref:TonB-dependent receptor n=1 Tax=Kineobactrum salinum TaxID=2708301 RepID=A0A6C0U4P0_9GAMM|nr:TonB-dependent receptor [Kineobactrum salinum]QIB66898.1 TonB-dependent receptor [Kineobactrum salinum]
MQKLITVVKYSLSFALVAGPSLLMAQSVESSSSTASAASEVDRGDSSLGAARLEEVVVTAQRRGEDLQSVPISISAVTASMADAMGIEGIQDVAIAAPAVNFGTTASGSNIRIRGVGASGSATDESANAIYIDGVYQSAAPALALPLNNIERIEVLKGPQGTLFGRNSTGGVIQVITRDPPEDPTLNLSVGYGNYETLETQAYMGSGITDELSVDLAIYSSDQNEGWGENLATGEDVYDGSSFSGRSKLLWMPGSRTKVTLAASYIDMDPLGSQGGNIFPGQRTVSAGGVAGSTYPGFFNIDHNSSDRKTVEQNQYSAKIEHDLDWAQLVSITSYSNTDFDFDWDNDGGRAFIAALEVFNSVEAITQELQLLSSDSSSIQWAAGLFYLNGVNSLDPLLVRGLSQGSPTASTELVSESDTDSYAVYGQATAPVFTDTNLTIGLRYTEDDRSLDSTVTTPTGLVLQVDDSENDTKLTWRLSLDHQLTVDHMVYASFDRGFKSGFYNTTDPFQSPIEPQVIDAYELGFKSELFDNRLRLNAAAFYYDYQDMQVRTGTPTGGVEILNAASSTITGVDIELVANPVQNLTLQGALSYLDADYDKFLNAPFFEPNPGGGQVQTFGDASGNDIVQVSDWAASLAGNYEIPINYGSIRLSSAVYYNSGYALDVQNRIEQGDYTLFNMSMAWVSPSDALEIRAWGRNLLDTHYRSTANSSALADIYFPGAPRTYGVTVSLRLL